ncbi:hypothetical protein GGTG_07569 [Gaeumannomyces tritici R3-111a-1]|uniref:Uncharacterized protein n=1 Tax=Gaeumannomyces tritici (strain R3-111a-1) TaxID=644352 RepID=J3P221_GAET3|nr:hypothetical protein GGTG_07569 [Gaeumannomyces tritici R3-111a-1]EJT73713.1 hypothetical protein GGTG_07569 [Gaeumannomyces tritici R3-111a-1]
MEAQERQARGGLTVVKFRRVSQETLAVPGGTCAAPVAPGGIIDGDSPHRSVCTALRHLRSLPGAHCAGFARPLDVGGRKKADRHQTENPTRQGNGSSRSDAHHQGRRDLGQGQGKLHRSWPGLGTMIGALVALGDSADKAPSGTLDITIGPIRFSYSSASAWALARSRIQIDYYGVRAL